MPTQKLQIEVPWPGDINRDFYRKKGESFPDEYPWDYWLAIPLVAAPLLWFAPSALPNDDRMKCRGMMELYRKLRLMLLEADVLPVGSPPSGSSVTGFLARGRKAGFLVLFREKNSCDAVVEISLPGLPDNMEWRRVVGDAEMTVEGSHLTFCWKASPGFAIYSWSII